MIKRKLTYLMQGIDVAIVLFCLTYLPIVIIHSDKPVWAIALNLFSCLCIVAAMIFHFKAVESMRE